MQIITRTFRILPALALCALVASIAAPAEAQAIKIGVFDPQRISENTAMGKQVQSALMEFRDGKQAEIDEKEKKISALRDELTQKQLSLSPDKRSTMEKDIQRQLLDLQGARETASRELQLEIAAAQASFEEKLFLAVEAFGKDEGFAILLPRDLVAWASPTVDVTTAIADRFNAMFPASE